MAGSDPIGKPEDSSGPGPVGKVRLRIGTRGSPLALIQAEEAKARLIAAHADLDAAAIEIVVIKTTGDQIQDRALAEIGGKGLFTKEIEEALFDGRIDIAVHSMKDVPTALPEGLEIACLLPREDPRDVLIGKGANSIAALPQNAVIGTASLRRQAQIRALRPDLRIVPLRGNVGTRLTKLERGDADATLLALAGLKRLGRADVATAILSVDEMLPAVAQGAIGIECRSDDVATKARLAPIHHQPTAIRVAAERSCLATLEGSCRTPIAVYAELQGDQLHLRALLAAPDGSRVLRDERRGPAADAAALGRAAGENLLAQQAAIAVTTAHSS